MQEKVRKYAYAWQPYINLQLDFVNDPEAEFRISFDRNDGSWSYVGTQAYSLLSRGGRTMRWGGGGGGGGGVVSGGPRVGGWVGGGGGGGGGGRG